MALISVIVPVYKVEKYIERCINSILKQTFTDFELILIDDGSPDNCGAICDHYAETDTRILVIHQENGGLSAARNTGIDWVQENSASEWITFIDSDDWVHEKYLETLYTSVKETGCYVSSVSYLQTDCKLPDIEDSQLQCTVWSVDEYYQQHNLPATIAWGKLYAKKCFEVIRYPIGKLHEDEFTTHKVLFMFDKIAIVDAPLYAYFVNSQGITKSEWVPKRLDVIEAFEQRIEFFEERKKDSLKTHTIKIYLYVIRKQITQIDLTGKTDYNKYKRYLYGKMGKCFAKYPRSVLKLLLKKIG